MKYDVIIVGAGSAGAVLASRLTEDPSRSVLLLEAGPDYPDIDTLPYKLKWGYNTSADLLPGDHDWGYVARSSATAAPMKVPRGKVTGGSSAVNGQMFLRGVPEDYDSWAELGNTEWGYEKLLPLFRRMETDRDVRDDFHGTDGPIVVRRIAREEWVPAHEAFYEACRSADFPDCEDFNSPDGWGVGRVPLNNLNGVRWSTSIGYLGPARHRLNLTIRADCRVRSVTFEGSMATGLMVESGGENFPVQAEEVILSAGAIGTPLILMHSGIGPCDQLSDVGIPVRHDLPGVGQNLRDHPVLFVTWSTKPEHEFDAEALRYPVIVRYTAPGSSRRNDMQLVILSFMTERVGLGGDGITPIGISVVSVLNLALGKGEIRVTSSDPDVPPFLDYNFLEEGEDRRRMRDAVRACVDLGNDRAFADIIEERIEPSDADLESDDSLDKWMLREVTTCHHISGTCKMGPADDPLAVVDQYGAVHGLQGLRIADTSIMPDCVRANTNATAIVIGERVSDFVLEGR